MQAASTTAANVLRSGPARWPIATISAAQLLGTSLWFSVNGVGPSLMQEWHATASDIGWLTSSTQVGFIVGTLLISLTGVADRFRASSLFVTAALAGALFNASFAWLSIGVIDAVFYRFAVGLCLAGIYPVGMKLLVTWVKERPGWALSLLVSMLTMGTALPHALKWGAPGVDWRLIASISSVLALVGAALIHYLGDGPYGPASGGDAPNSSGGWSRITAAFRMPAYRAAALGYFGHMWELYAFWTVLPLILVRMPALQATSDRSVSALAFLIIAAGTAGCILGGLASKRVGSARVAACALAISGLSGAAFLLGWRYLPPGALMILLLLWGASVIADSPHFSALSAKACDPQSVGTALAVQNSIGFTITIVSISFVTRWFDQVGTDAAWLLVAGPVVGLWLFRPLLRQPAQ